MTRCQTPPPVSVPGLYTKFFTSVLIATTALVLAACGGSSAPAGPTGSAQAPGATSLSTDCTVYLDRLSRADHASPDFAELADNTRMADKCITQPRAKAAEAASALRSANPTPGFVSQVPGRAHALDARPTGGFINFESAHVHPLDMTPDGQLLLAVNTANQSLEVFSITNGALALQRTIAVGIDPISVRARTNTEAWVVNKVSDSISVVDLSIGTVTRTIDTDNEPSDVVFAANGSKAFVSCAQPNRVMVFSLANLALAPTRINVLAEKPRAMAVSPDGSKVYVAAFESGNATTAMNGRVGPIGTGVDLGSDNVVSLAVGPYGGVNPPPNSGNTFSPPKNPLTGNQVSSVIVKKRPNGVWTDGNGRDWSRFISGADAARTRRVAGWDLPDRDVVIIDAATNAVSYQRGLMNIVMAMAVNPVSGEVTVVGTDATNEIRFEPVINGVFLRVNQATFQPGGVASVTDLNTHLNYAVRNIAPAQRQQSIGDPRGIQWNAAGTQAFVTGMGSNNLIVMGPQGQRLGRVAVGQGPTGVVLNEGAGRAYVLNKFDATISIVDMQSLAQTGQVGFFDPTPAVIKAGRPFLYDTQRTSGLGHLSCASCHVDARIDRLAWDLGDPSGSMSGVHHPMKGPMMTQTLQDIMRFPNLHWRGDRANLAAFNPAYVSLMGADAPISAAEMTAFGNFLATIHFEPNPYRNENNTLPATLAMPNGVTASPTNGRAALAGCLPCHLASQTRTNVTNAELSQNVIPPSFHHFYQRLGFWNSSATNSTSGFGFFHDGVDPLLSAARSNDLLAAILTFDGPGNSLVASELRQDTHAAVGRQLTLQGAATAAQSARLTQLIGLANNSVHVAMVATATLDGGKRAWRLAANNSFVSAAGNPALTRAALEALAAANQPVTFTLVVEGTEAGITANLDSLVTVVANRPPVVNNPGAQNTTQNSAAALSIVATDPDGDSLSYSAVGLPTGLQINAGTGAITGTASAQGLFSVSVSVTDSRSASASINFQWTVSPVVVANRPPVVTNPGARSSVLNSAVALNIVASDPDGDSLSYSAVGLPTGLQINAGTGAITGSVSTPGSFNVSVTVTDSRNASGSANFQWTVTAPVGPTLTAAQSSVSAGGSVTVNWSGIANPTNTDWIGLFAPGAAAESYLDWIYVSCTTSPGPALASGTCPFQIPATRAAGTYQLRLYAANGFTLLANGPTLSVTQTVSNSPPTVALTSPANNTSVVQGSAVTISAQAADTDGSIARVEFYAGSTLLGTDTTAPYSISWSAATLGTQSITARAYDNAGAVTASAAVNLTVNAVATTLTAAASSVIAGGSVTVSWSAIANPTSTDWIGLFTPGAAATSYLDWIYVSCSTAAVSARASGTCSFQIPATRAAGTYQLRLYAADGYTLLTNGPTLSVTR